MWLAGSCFFGKVRSAMLLGSTCDAEWQRRMQHRDCAEQKVTFWAHGEDNTCLDTSPVRRWLNSECSDKSDGWDVERWDVGCRSWWLLSSAMRGRGRDAVLWWAWISVFSAGVHAGTIVSLKIQVWSIPRLSVPFFDSGH